MARHVWGLVAMVVLAASAGCSGAQTAAGPPAWIGSPQALRTGVMGDEVSQSGVGHDAVADDASLAYLDAQTACFDVTVRSLASDDVALAHLHSECHAGEATAPAAPRSSAMVSVYDYDAQGSMQTVVDHTPAEAYHSSPPAAPADGVHRVVERSARLCCDIAATDTLDLTMGTTPTRSVTLHWDLH